MKRTCRNLLVAVISLLPTLAGQTRDDYPDNARSGPALGVARVSMADGDVSVRRGASSDLIQALGGMPLLAHDSIQTASGSRAEVQLGPANFLRLGADTEVKVVELGNRHYRMAVVKGYVSYSEMRSGQADVEIETPQATLRPLKSGVYKMMVRDGEETIVTVRKGEAEVATANRSETLKKDRSVIVRGDRKTGELVARRAEREDSFDKWNERRDQLLTRQPSYRGWGGPGYYDPWYFGFGYGYGFWGSPWYYGPRTYVTVAAPIRGGHGGGGRHR